MHDRVRGSSQVRSERGARGLSWRPIVTADGDRAHLAARLADAVDEARAALAAPGPDLGTAGSPRQSASLEWGGAGRAVLWAYPGCRAPSAAARAQALLESALAAVEQVPMEPMLFGGLIGILWATECCRRHLPDADLPDVEGVEVLLRDGLAAGSWRGHYDLGRGLVGIGLYALERPESQVARELAALVVQRLIARAREVPGGFAWRTDARWLPAEQRERSPDGAWDLGVAHGNAGAIALLGRAWGAGVERERVEGVLDGAVSWLLAQRRSDPLGAYSSFAGGDEPRGRTAWCYGDLGVAAALNVVASCTGDARCLAASRSLAEAAAVRPPEACGVGDPGLCHGAAGLAHILNRLYQETGSETLRDASLRWIERCLDMRQPGRGVAGWATYWRHPSGEVEWLADRGLLTGVSGVVLALQSAACDQEADWDRALLLSAAPWERRR